MGSSSCWPAETPSGRDDEAGFTLLETLIALAVFSIALISFWALAARLGTAFAKSGDSGAASVKAATLDRALRSLCSRVEPPFWAMTPPGAFSENQAGIPYLDGKADSFLRVTASTRGDSSRSSVSLEAGKTLLGIDGLESFSLSPLLSADGRLAGLKAVFSCGGREYLTQAPFASYSLIRMADK